MPTDTYSKEHTAAAPAETKLDKKPPIKAYDPLDQAFRAKPWHYGFQPESSNT